MSSDELASTPNNNGTSYHLPKNKSLINVLLAARPFRYLDKSTIESVLRYGECVQYSDAEPILQQGKLGEGLYILVSGKAVVTVKLLVKANIKLAKLKLGDFFGEVNLIAHTPCTTSVISDGHSVCFILTKLSFEMLSAFFAPLHYEINRALIEDVAERQAAMINQIKTLLNKRKIKNHPTKKRGVKRHVKLGRNSFLKKFSYLHRLPTFNIFDEDEFNQLIRNSNVIKVTDNFKLIKPGEKKLSCYCILSGAIRLMIEDANLAVFGPTTFLFPTYLINKKQEISYVTCGTTTLLEITDAQMQLMQKKHQQQWFKLYGLVCIHIVSLQLKLNTLLVRLTSETTEPLSQPKNRR